MDDYHGEIRPLRTIRALIPNEEINTKQNGKILITLFIERIQIYSTLNMPPQ